MTIYTKEQWLAQGSKLFGSNFLNWRFKCPSCGYIASVLDYKNAGAPGNSVAFSCVGRWMSNSKEAFIKDNRNIPCNYAGGGLFQLNPVEVDGSKYFEFAANNPLHN